MDSRTTWPSLIGALIRGETLSADETSWAMAEIMEGAATPVQIAAFSLVVSTGAYDGSSASDGTMRVCSCDQGPGVRSGPKVWL